MTRTTADGDLERIRELYQQTVMDVPHYEEEYDEPLEVNMAAELSEEVATAVDQGSSYTPQLQTALVQQAKRAREHRKSFMHQLEREAKSLEEASSHTASIDRRLAAMDDAPLTNRSFPELLEIWDRLEALDDEVAELIEDRQRFIHEADEIGLHLDIGLLQTYLYRHLDVSYPVLAAGAEVAEKIQDARSRVAVAVARRA